MSKILIAGLAAVTLAIGVAGAQASVSRHVGAVAAPVTGYVVNVYVDPCYWTYDIYGNPILVCD